VPGHGIHYEVTDRATSLAPILIARDVRPHVALEPLGVVPMCAGRVTGSPLLPACIGRREIDEIPAIPVPAQRQVGVEGGECAGGLYKSVLRSFEQMACRIVAMPFALDGARGETLIESQGQAHRIVFDMDPVRREPRILREAFQRIALLAAGR